MPGRALPALALALALVAICCHARPAPVVLVTGLSGSALEERDTTKWHKDWKRIWVDVWDDLAEITRTLEYLQLDWHNENNTYTNKTGIEVRPVDFGGTEGVDYLCKLGALGIEGSDYYHKMIRSFEKKGYEKNYDIVGAPFDWRLPRSGLEQIGWFDAVESLIEKLHDQFNQSVVVIGHCYGAVILAEHWSDPRFDTPASRAWKEKNVKALVSVAGPFLGAPVALEMVLSGSDDGYEFLGIPLFPREPMKVWGRTLGAMASLTPRPGYIPDDATIVATPSRNYTISQMMQAIKDSGATSTIEQMQHMKKIGYDTPSGHPGVRVYCAVAKGLDTVAGWKYTHDDDPFDHKAKALAYIDGDGTVPVTSASWCKTWQSQRPDLKFEYEEWEDLEHLGILKNKKFHEAIYTKVLADGE